MSFDDRVYEVIKGIPRGNVMSYGQVALHCGKPGAARAVGNALHRNPNHSLIPCHRVVNSVGRLSQCFVFGGINVQRQLLIDEGITFNGDNVRMPHHQLRGR